MGKYVKKPVEVEARQWNVEGWEGPAESRAPEIIQWIKDNGGEARFSCEDNEDELLCSGDVHDHTIIIETLEGPMHAWFDYWIIKGVEGEFYACKPEIFEKTYEEVKK